MSLSKGKFIHVHHISVLGPLRRLLILNIAWLYTFQMWHYCSDFFLNSSFIITYLSELLRQFELAWGPWAGVNWKQQYMDLAHFLSTSRLDQPV